MGVGRSTNSIRSSSRYDYTPTPALAKLPNPDPNNYKIVKAEEVGDFLILKINYPDCTNYEGNKIIVFKGVKPIDLLNQRVIDPHFFQNPKIASPIARFTPTEWDMAIRFAICETEYMSRKSI